MRFQIFLYLNLEPKSSPNCFKGRLDTLHPRIGANAFVSGGFPRFIFKTEIALKHSKIHSDFEVVPGPFHKISTYHL